MVIMALVTIQRSCSINSEIVDGGDEKEEINNLEDQRGTSECYFAVKGAALVLPHDECLHVYRKTNAHGASDLQQHLQAMFYLLRNEDILKMAVKLESVHSGRTRYLVVVSCMGHQQTEESCLLGIDCNSKTTIGLVLPVWADTRITLDGDGGFSVSSNGRHHIFKPVSVQAMWSALQALHKASSKAREYNYFTGGVTHNWIDYYENRIDSDRSCLNEWHAMDDLESRRPPSPDTVRSEPTEREATEKLIRTKLKELMMSVDLDEVTSKFIRTSLEEQLDVNLNEFKSFIDQEMLTILGQMDAPTEIFQYLYLGSEWNASNLEELKFNGVGHILNVTREIDNFFPGMFDYLNVRVYDDESTEMLQHWDKTYKYITKAKDEGSKVLVHCKMGISRSASVVIAYVMKAYDWNLQQALHFVKNKRNCIKPNSGFIKQLEIYQGILDASKHRHNSLWRSKSETNLKSPDKPKRTKKEEKKDEDDMYRKDGQSLALLGIPGTTSRPKSWSPDDAIVNMLFPPDLCSEERVTKDDLRSGRTLGKHCYSTDRSCYEFLEKIKTSVIQANKENKMNCSSQVLDNNIENLLKAESTIPRVSSIKDRINELESHANALPSAPRTSRTEKTTNVVSRSGLVLNLATHFETGSKPGTPSPVDEGLTMKNSIVNDQEIVEPVISQTKPPVPKHHAVLVKPSPWSSETNPRNILTSSSQYIQVQALEQKVHSEALLNHIPQETVSTHLSESSESDSTLLSVALRKKDDKFEDENNIYLTSRSTSTLCQHPRSRNSSGNKDDCMLNLIKKEKTSHVLKDSPCNSGGLNLLTDKRHLQVMSKLPIEHRILPTLHCACVTQENVPQDISDSNSPDISQHPGLPKPIFTVSPEESSQTFSSDISQTLPCTKKFSYEKEDIPWTPGTVLRTKQQIEEKNLTRTSSFDNGFPSYSQSMPSTPPEIGSLSTKPVQRSQSLRSEHRSDAIFSGKWYPLPSLASSSTLKSLSANRKSALFTSKNKAKSDIVHSISTPSVVEAVNEVICGTHEILSSAIRSLPANRHSVPPSSCTTPSPISKQKFGNISSMPDMKISDSALLLTGMSAVVSSECEKYQREFTEGSKSKLNLAHKNTLDCALLKKENIDYCRNPVPNDLQSEESSKESGLVKRIRKEIEAKSNYEASKKGNVINQDAKDSGDCVWYKHVPASGRSASTPSSPDMDSRSRTTCAYTELFSTKRPSTCSDGCSTRHADERVQQPPPTPHRKASLDLDCFRKSPLTPVSQKKSSVCPTADSSARDINLNNQNLIKSSKNSSTNGFQKTVAEHPSKKLKDRSHQPIESSVISPGRPPPVTKITSTFSVMPSPQSVLGQARKVHKQQGSSHPLSKLNIRQRHANPLYNTM